MNKPDFQFAPMADCNTAFQRRAIERIHGHSVDRRHEVHKACPINCPPNCTDHLTVMTPELHLAWHEDWERIRRWETQEFR